MDCDAAYGVCNDNIWDARKFSVVPGIKSCINFQQRATEFSIGSYESISGYMQRNILNLYNLESLEYMQWFWQFSHLVYIRSIFSNCQFTAVLLQWSVNVLLPLLIWILGMHMIFSLNTVTCSNILCQRNHQLRQLQTINFHTCFLNTSTQD